VWRRDYRIIAAAYAVRRLTLRIKSLRRKGPDLGFFIAVRNGPLAHFLFENIELGVSDDE